MVFKSKLVSSLFGILFASAFIGNVYADNSEPKSPESINGTTKVNAEGFIELVDTLPELIVIDSRIPGDRKQGYVEGSVSLPDIDTNCDTLAQNIPEKKSAALFYCNGVKCGRSAKAVQVALSCGYNNVYWFRGGFEEWLAKGYPYLQE